MPASQIARYEWDGYIIVRNLFSTDELAPLRAALSQDHSLGGECFKMLDVDGGTLDAAAWVERSPTLVGLMPFADRTVSIATALLGEEIYHWHSKLTIKQPFSAGRVEWHQDYGAWYYEGCLEPSLLTVGIAIEPTTKQNGCLQVVRGSHKLGRVDHEYVENAQHRVDPHRLAQAKTKLATIHVTLDVGDAVFFHCNLLHGSDGNTTDQHRTLLLSTYNAASNSPFGEAQLQRRYKPVTTVTDATFQQARYEAAIAGHAFVRPDSDQMHGFGANSFE